MNSLDKEAVKEKIRFLVEKYRNLRREKGDKELKNLSEANVRADFIDPLFEILGWDTKDPDEYDREHFIRGTGFADVALKLKGEPIIFIEAKRFGGVPYISERGDGDWTMEERQAILYAARANCKWAILTNFEKFRVFNASNGLTILNIEVFWEYEKRLDELLYLTKEAVQSGRIEKLAEREEKPDIDLEFLRLLNRWRITLANDIYENNRDNEALKNSEGKIDLGLLKNAVQRILDRLIIVRWAEDRMILEDPTLLKRKLDDWKASPTYNSIVDLLFADRALFDRFNETHNGKIFERGHICEKVKISDEVLGGIIEEMLGRSFRKFDFDVLGNTYETYLGHTLYLKEDGRLDLKPSGDTRKKSGIYYTPPYVVDYIVKNTLGELLKGKTAEEVERIRVLDPACGSGSFLIKAFDYLEDFYIKENERIQREKEERIKEFLEKNGNQFDLENLAPLQVKGHTDFREGILKNNIFGVDLDGQAAEIASVNLMLKTLKPHKKLPLILGENIKVGNSLISGSEEELKRYFGEDWQKKRPFNWESEFPQAFDERLPEEERGFDVIIGNPPYIRVQNLPAADRTFFSENFESSFGSYDIYILFVEKAISLLKEGGKMAFIMPLKFFRADYGRGLRKLITERCNIDMIVDFGTTKVFGDATTYPCLLFLTKQKEKKKELTYIRVKRNPADIMEIAEKMEGWMRSKAQSEQETIDNEKYEIFRALQTGLSDKPWYFLTADRAPVFKKLSKVGRKLGDIAPRIFQGLVTGGDPLFFVRVIGEEGKDTVRVENNHKKTYLIEKSILRPLLKGEDIRRWHHRWSGLYIIYPYEINRGKGELLSIERLKKDYPLAWKYFLAHEGELKSRENGLWQSRTDWYAYGRRQNIEMFEQVKLMTGVLSKRASFTLDTEGKFYFVGGGNAGGYGIILNNDFRDRKTGYRFLLSLLNSKLLDFYLHTISTKFQNDYFSYAKRFIEKLPIVEAPESVQEKLAGLADRMLALHSRLSDINTDFDRHVSLHTRVKDSRLKEYIDRLPVKDKEVLNNANKIREKIVKLEVIEEGEWLKFMVSYREKKKENKTKNITINALKCRFPDAHIRKFILYSIREYTTPGKLRGGTIYDCLLKIRLPAFHENREENLKQIHELMEPFLIAVEKSEQIRKEIDETDREIDGLIYRLYGLTEEEIRIVEDSFA